METTDERRLDWATAHIVDEVILYLLEGGRPYIARRYMKECLVPITVQDRVLGNSAVLRHRRA